MRGPSEKRETMSSRTAQHFDTWKMISLSKEKKIHDIHIRSL